MLVSEMTATVETEIQTYRNKLQQRVMSRGGPAALQIKHSPHTTPRHKPTFLPPPFGVPPTFLVDSLPKVKNLMDVPGRVHRAVNLGIVPIAHRAMSMHRNVLEVRLYIRMIHFFVDRDAK